VTLALALALLVRTRLGFGRIVVLYNRPSTSHHVNPLRESVPLCEATMRPNPNLPPPQPPPANGHIVHERAIARPQRPSRSPQAPRRHSRSRSRSPFCMSV
jgi:hypothetical protein